MVIQFTQRYDDANLHLNQIKDRFSDLTESLPSDEPEDIQENLRGFHANVGQFGQDMARLYEMRGSIHQQFPSKRIQDELPILQKKIDNINTRLANFPPPANPQVLRIRKAGIQSQIKKLTKALDLGKRIEQAFNDGITALGEIHDFAHTHHLKATLFNYEHPPQPETRLQKVVGFVAEHTLKGPAKAVAGFVSNHPKLAFAAGTLVLSGALYGLTTLAQNGTLLEYGTLAVDTLSQAAKGLSSALPATSRLLAKEAGGIAVGNLAAAAVLSLPIAPPLVKGISNHPKIALATTVMAAGALTNLEETLKTSFASSQEIASKAVVESIVPIGMVAGGATAIGIGYLARRQIAKGASGLATSAAGKAMGAYQEVRTKGVVRAVQDNPLNASAMATVAGGLAGALVGMGALPVAATVAGACLGTKLFNKIFG